MQWSSVQWNGLFKKTTSKVKAPKGIQPQKFKWPPNDEDPKNKDPKNYPEIEDKPYNEDNLKIDNETKKKWNPKIIMTIKWKIITI